jgi:catechol 2,3-dioxygenase-like lactoylglutathione lyase family enzyme
MGFYRDFFRWLEWDILRDQPSKFGAGDRNGAGVWVVCPAKEAHNDYDGAGMNHLAVIVDEQQDVDRTCAFLELHGIRPLFGTPRHRPEFCHTQNQTYYQVMFATPDGILFEVYYKGSPAPVTTP